jgi:hypothetical protein
MRAGAVATLALLAVTGLAAGAAAAATTAAETPTPFETVLAEAHSGLEEERREVIRDEASWVRVWGEIHAGVAPLPTPPPVDFTSHMLILVASGTRPSGGFAIKVQSVTPRGQSLEVVVHETCPAKGARVSMALSQPVEVVRLPKRTLALSFKETRSSSCH